MRNHLFYSLLGLSALLLASACQKQELQPDPVLKLNVSVVTVGQDGGPRSVVYQVENPVEGTEVSASTAESWIQDLTVNPSESSITFNVEANTGSEREGVVTVSYSGAEDVTFTVKQAVYVAPVLELETENVPVPARGGSRTVSYELQNAVADAHVTASLADAECDWITDLTVDETASTISFKVAENTDYNSDRTAVINVEYPGVETEPAITVTQEAAVDPATLAFAVTTTVNGPTISFSVDPKDYDGYWYYVLAESSALEEYTVENMIASTVSQLNETVQYYVIYGGYTEDFVLSMLVPSGKLVLAGDFDRETEYVFIPFQYSADGNAGEHVEVYATTGSEVSPSDNQLTISAGNVKPTSADINISGTTDEAYLYMVASSDYTAGDSDDDIISDMLQEYSLEGSVYLGAGATATSFNLAPDMDFTVYAFGYAGGEATTGLFTYDFSTPEVEMGTAELNMNYKFFDGEASVAAAEAVNPDLADMLESNLVNGADAFMLITAESDSDEIYWTLFNYTQEIYSQDDALRMELFTYSSEMQNSTSGLFLVNYADEPDMFLAGIAVDENGNPGPLFKSEPIAASTEDVSDPEELIEYLLAPATMSTKSGAAPAFGTPAELNAKVGKVSALNAKELKLTEMR